MKTKVSVIIPNWNGKSLLEDSLSSLGKQTFKEFETIVVDNGSTDGSVEYMKSSFPNVIVVLLDRNYGFAKAINEGVKASNSEYVAFLNNDTKVDPHWLDELVKVADRYLEVISVNSKLLNFYDQKIIDGVGVSVNEVGQAKSIGWHEKDNGQYDSEMYIFGATGGAALFRRELFIKLGMFDENFFMYFEEVDFAFRAQFQGYKSMYCPTAVVFHKHKASSKKRPQYLEYWQFKNMTQTIIKDMPTTVLLRNWRWLKIIMVHLNTIFYQLKNGFIWPPIATDLWLLVHLPALLHKRVQIQSRRKVSDEYIESFLAPKKVTFWGFVKQALSRQL